MKSTGVIIGLLVLNLAVVAGLLVYLMGRQPAPVAVSGITNLVGTAKRVSLAPTNDDLKVVVITNQIQWAQLESEDYHEYIARLRSIGCPENTIRDIIIADLDKLMAPEIRAIYGRRREIHYWNSVEEELANDVDPREVSRRTAEIEKRKREIVRELVGADLVRERAETQGEEDFFERRLSFLPEERRTQVREILEKFQESEQRLRAKELEDGDPLNAGDRAEIRQLARQRDAELNQLLSPEERAQFELWMSSSAGYVRHAMYGMNSSEQEFVAAYQARRKFDEKWADRDEMLLDASSRAELQKDRDGMEQEIKSQLGDDRYALYQRGQDEDYHSLSALATRFKIPKEKAADVYGYKRVAQDIRAQLTQNQELSSDQRARAMQAIADETAAAVRAALGERAFRYYLRTGQGTWIKE